MGLLPVAGTHRDQICPQGAGGQEGTRLPLGQGPLKLKANPGHESIIHRIVELEGSPIPTPCKKSASLCIATGVFVALCLRFNHRDVPSTCPPAPVEGLFVPSWLRG